MNMKTTKECRLDIYRDDLITMLKALDITDLNEELDGICVTWTESA